ncbi:MAG: tRNA (adenosine(37)-N6)-dimethylallyltransferase MiaA [Armatimonadota bacterium]|nr:tRNA (adenosine(37)-N6)-dimethylallyltransferase MiaA [Armatimonadota bacterium]
MVGPTAAGKTAVGIALARRLGAEIVSADSMQVYRRMDIGTAKPTPSERAQAWFHGLDVTDPDADWTLADFQRLGESACAEIAARGNLPLIVGGTGLYVRALTTRLEIPHTPPDEEFRARWRQAAQEGGNEFVQSELARVDPEAAGRIHVNDLGRLIRALEVYEATGVSLSEWHARNRAQTDLLDVRLFGVNFADRRLLYACIDARVDQMLAEGFLDEVRGLLALGYGRELKPMHSLGYRQMAAHLAGELTWAEAVAQTKQETRHFARRQLIWFRADKRIQWLEAADKTPDALADAIAEFLSKTDTHEGDYEADEQAAD